MASAAAQVNALRLPGDPSTPTTMVFHLFTVVSSPGVNRSAPDRSRRAGRRPARRDLSGADRLTPGEETTVNRWKTIVVGVDGSPGSRKALTWAAAEAMDHG